MYQGSQTPPSVWCLWSNSHVSDCVRFGLLTRYMRPIKRKVIHRSEANADVHEFYTTHYL